MECWMPVMHVHKPDSNGQCRHKAFTPHGTEKGASDFWADMQDGIQFMITTFNMPAIELQVVHVECEHVNFSDDCFQCSLWLEATVTDDVEEDDNAHSS